MDRLIIDPEFRDKIPPLTEDEFSLLEENILSDGAVFSPLIVWDGTILDGHNRYEIIQKHPELTYAVHKLSFANRYEALSWICKNQLGRRNLTPQQKKYLIGQRYEAEKQADAFHGNQHTASDESGADKKCPHQNSRHVTQSRIAKETNTSASYVREAGTFAKGVDAAEEALPGIKQESAWNVVVSNLALHYIEDLDQVFRNVWRTLRPGGIFLFNIEHPIFTSGVHQDWIYGEDGTPRYWPVDDYYRPGQRVTRFLGCEVIKQHHTLTQILMGLLNCGFTLEVVEEVQPSEKMLEMPGMKDELRRPMMLLVRAKREAAGAD